MLHCGSLNLKSGFWFHFLLSLSLSTSICWSEDLLVSGIARVVCTTPFNRQHVPSGISHCLETRDNNKHFQKCSIPNGASRVSSRPMLRNPGPNEKSRRDNVRNTWSRKTGVANNRYTSCSSVMHLSLGEYCAANMETRTETHLIFSETERNECQLASCSYITPCLLVARCRQHHSQQNDTQLLTKMTTNQRSMTTSFTPLLVRPSSAPNTGNQNHHRPKESRPLFRNSIQ